MNRSIAHWINDVCVWIDQTALSQIIQSTSWIVPTVQSVHILAIAAVVASALMINLRLLGVFAADQPLKDVLARFLPFVWWPLLVLLLCSTGGYGFLASVEAMCSRHKAGKAFVTCAPLPPMEAVIILADGETVSLK